MMARAYVRRTSQAARTPDSGSNRSSAGRRFSCAAPLRNSIIESAAELAPMTSVGYALAAMVQ